jgi:hypothetical protein
VPASSTQLFNPLLSTPQPVIIPELYAETEARIKQALHQLHDCENPNIAAAVREFRVSMTNCALNKTDVKRHLTGQSQLIA